MGHPQPHRGTSFWSITGLVSIEGFNSRILKKLMVFRILKVYNCLSLKEKFMLLLLKISIACWILLKRFSRKLKTKLKNLPLELRQPRYFSLDLLPFHLEWCYSFLPTLTKGEIKHKIWSQPYRHSYRIQKKKSLHLNGWSVSNFKCRFHEIPCCSWSVWGGGRKLTLQLVSFGRAQYLLLSVFKEWNTFLHKYSKMKSDGEEFRIYVFCFKRWRNPVCCF